MTRKIFGNIILVTAVGLTSGAFAATIDLSTVTADTILNNHDVITGTLGKNVKLSIANNALVTLRNATINGASSDSYKWAGLTCEGNAQIRIDGTNYVKGFQQNYPSIFVPEGKTLTIRQAVNIPGYAALGGGTLTAPGHNNAAGIGAGFDLPCGNIVIESGIIFATGKQAAGIGGAGGVSYGASCGDITIKGGVVCAMGGFDGAGIGGGGSAGCGNITIEDGVTLVVAQAGSKNDPAPIGAGGGGTCGDVTVTLADGATDKTEVKNVWYLVRTIERPSIVQQYANGVAWKFRIVDGKAEICDEYYTSDGEAHYRPAIVSDTAGALVIPDILGGCPVTRIGNEAFRDCNKITSVTIPASVTSIGERAFQRCELLTKVTMPPSGVTDIGERAFESCGSLTSVTIPATVTSIGYMAFDGCDDLTSVTIPGGVKRIADSAFAGCDNLTNVTIEDGVETIGESAFGYCGSLKSVTIPPSVKTIEARAFENCTSLATANISGGTTVEDEAFFNCMALSDANRFVIINGVLHQYVGGEADVTVPAGVTRIGAMAFAAHTSNPAFGAFPPLVSVTIPDSVTSIGAMAFAYCTDLERVTFPANMPSVEDGAFSLCVKLADEDGFVVIGGALQLYIGNASEVTIPDGVTSIGPESFINYTGIPPHYFWTSPVNSLTIPSGVTKIGPRAFNACPELTTVCIPSSVTDIGEGAFWATAMSVSMPLQTVHVEAGDTERVKGLLFAAGHPVDGITFVEDYVPSVPDPVNPGTEPSVPDPVNPGTEPCYAVLNEGDITSPYVAGRSLYGALYDSCDVVGIVELKLGKINAKKGTSRVSGAVTLLDGKRYTIKGFVAAVRAAEPLTVSLEVKTVGRLSVTIGDEQFAGTLGSWHVQTATVGGNWNSAPTVAVDASDLSVSPGTVLDALVPNDEKGVSSGTRWTFAKATSVKWAKPKVGETPVVLDAASGKGLLVDTTKDRTNLSGMKLTYTAKKGTFKGSFKVYALEGSGASTKLKKYNLKVGGVVVNGVGYGEATCKRPAITWSLKVR